MKVFFSQDLSYMYFFLALSPLPFPYMYIQFRLSRVSNVYIIILLFDIFVTKFPKLNIGKNISIFNVKVLYIVVRIS